MQLGKRLGTIAAFIKDSDCTADIGTDHGMLAAFLTMTDKARSVIAGDKNHAPCLAAKKTAERLNLTDKITVRQGDGLKVIDGTADNIVIAGMGGSLITNILAADLPKAHAAKRLILQPNINAAGVRRFLFEHGWHIVDEALAEENGIIYEIIVAENGALDMPDEFSLLVGPVLLRDKPPLFCAHVNLLRHKLTKQLVGMDKSDNARNSEEYLRRKGLLDLLINCLRSTKEKRR